MSNFMIIYGLEEIFKMQLIDNVMYFMFFFSTYVFVALIFFAIGSFYQNYKHEKEEG